MSLTTSELMLVEQRVTNEAPRASVAFLLWLFLGFFSGHRFYLGRTGSAIAQIILNCLVIGLIWTFIDVFLISGMVRAEQDAIRNRHLTQMAVQ